MARSEDIIAAHYADLDLKLLTSAFGPYDNFAVVLFFCGHNFKFVFPHHI